jgi:hypothetical protein
MTTPSRGVNGRILRRRARRNPVCRHRFRDRFDRFQSRSWGRHVDARDRSALNRGSTPAARHAR